MWLQALLTAEDLHSALGRITPARITLDKDDPERHLWVSRPENVELRGGRDVLITAHAQLRWDVIGIPLPVTLRRVAIALTPAIEKVDGQDALTFALHVEEADLSAVPAFVEDTLLSRVNEALDKPEARLTWRFVETLDFHFPLPVVEPARTMSLFARWGAVRVADDGLAMVVGWGVDAKVLGDAPLAIPPRMVQESAPSSAR